MFPKLYRKEIEDQWTQENFRIVMDFFNLNDPTRFNFKFFQIDVPGAIANFKSPHNLGYQPKDILITHNSENAVVTFNWSKFDEFSIDLTSSGPTVLRLLMGRYE